jgi:23S rRNA (uridine2552-2'-O)-methyltransferase
LISDIAPNTTGSKWADAQQSLLLVKETLRIAEMLLLPKGHYIVKVFQGEDFPQFVSDLKQRFEMVKVIKPQSSRVESREVFVLGMGFKKQLPGPGL